MRLDAVHTQPLTRGRRALFACAALLAFAAVRLLPECIERTRQAGSGMLAQDARAEALLSERHDIVFLGSSTAIRQVDPDAFDERLAELGRPGHRSFNLGLPSAAPFELTRLLDEVLRDAAPRWVVIEADPFALGILEHGLNERAARAVDVAHAPEILRFLWGGDLPLRERLGFVDQVGQLALEDALGYGALRELARGVARRPEHGDRGFTCLDELAAERQYRVRRQALLRDPDAYAAQIAALQRPVESRVLTPTHRDWLAALAERAAASGATLMYLHPPTVLREDEFRPVTSWCNQTGRMCLELGDPAQRPELFAFEDRFDTEHLSCAGARLYSRQLAEAFAAAAGAR